MGFVKSNTNQKEYFFQKTVELTDLAIDPIRFKINENSDKQTNFFNALNLVIPLNKNNKNFEIFIDNAYNILPEYLNGNSQLRLIVPLYQEYLTIICDFANNILTYQDMLADCSKRDFFIVSDNNNQQNLTNMLNIIKILFPQKKYSFYYLSKFPTKINQKAFYCSFCTEHSDNLITLSKKNNFFIIEFPENHPNYRNLSINYQNIYISKYDISFHGSNNIKRVIKSFRNSVNLWTYNKVPRFKIYALIKTLFENLDFIKKNIKNSTIKYVFEITAEKMIILTIVPLHSAVEQYYRELYIFTNNEDPLCINNTVSALPCNPSVIFDNRYRLLNLYGT